MALLFSDPVDALRKFQQALDTSRASSWLDSSPSGSGAYPPLNVFRRGDDLVVITELPGIRKEELQVQVKGNTIRLAGTKSVSYAEKASVHRRERLAGRFDRAITIPFEIDADKVKAECRDGVLAVVVPRHEREKPRSVKIA